MKKNKINELLEVTYVDEKFIVLENIVLLHNNFCIEKIYCFADDVVEMVRFDEYVVCGNSKGVIIYGKYKGYTNEENIFEGHVAVIHDDAITGLSIWEDYLLSGSRDGVAKLSRVIICEDGRLRFIIECIFKWTDDTFYISAVAYKYGILAIARSNYMLEIYKTFKLEEGIKYCEIISMQKSHIKQINHILISQEMIVTSSSDRTAKIYTHEGKMVKSVIMDRVMYSVADKNQIAIFSHKIIKIYNMKLKEIATLQLKKPVLSAYFYEGYLLCISDILRVYDIVMKKCIKTYDFNLRSAWSFDFPIICGENRLLIIEDESLKIRDQLWQELRVIREDSFIVEKHRRDENYDAALAILAKGTDYKKIYTFMYKAYEKDKELKFLEYFSGTKNKIYDAILKTPYFKYSEVFNAIVAQEGTKTSDRVIKNKILKIIEKHFKGITELFCDLKGMD